MGKNKKRHRLIWVLVLFIGYSVGSVQESSLIAKQFGELAELRAQVQTMNDQAPSSPRSQNTQGVRMRPPTLSEIDQRVQLLTSPDSIADTYLMFGRSMSRSAPNIIPEVIDRVSRLEGITMLEKQSYIADLYAQLYQVSDVDSALIFFNEAEQAYEQLGKYNDLIRVIISKARLLARKNDYLAAEGLYFSALDIAKQADLPIEVTELYRSELLNLYVRVGAVELALSEYERIMAQKPSIKLSEQCSYLLSLSNSYKMNFDYIRAAELLLKCSEIEDLSPEDPRYGLQIAIYRSLSDLARLNEQPVERRKWAELALNESEMGGRVDFNTYLTLIQVYREQGLQDSLAPLFSKMDEIPERLVQLPSRLLYIKEKGSYLNSKQREQEAVELLQNGLRLAERTDVSGVSLLNDLRAELAKSYAQLGQNDRAYSLMSAIRVDELEALQGAQIQQEQMAKVRFQMRAKNDELKQIANQLSTTQRFGLVGFIIFFAVIGFVIYRTKKESKLRIEKTRNRISQDLHDDISASLNSISFYASALKTGESNGNTENFLQQITEISSDAAERVSDIIWAIQLKSIKWKAFTTKTRRFALDLCESKNIELDAEIEANTNMSLSQEQNYDFWLAFKEVFTNALRHSKSTKIELKLYTFGKNVHLELSDDGVGFDRSRLSHENGLKNIEERMHRLHGTAELQTDNGQGTKWFLTFPLG